jgi:hypothetical protein
MAWTIDIELDVESTCEADDSISDSNDVEEERNSDLNDDAESITYEMVLSASN